ncbi:MAG: ChaN family lipoprotein [Paracoccaceae bacterium]
MNILRFLVLGVTVLLAQIVAADVPDTAKNSDVVILGEVHDNPAHHIRQAAWVAQLRPSAVVFEMLTPDQAAKITSDMLGKPNEIATAVDWANSNWPDFSIYAPIFAATDQAAIYGAGLDRNTAMAAAQQTLEDAFGPDAAQFGLTNSLDTDQQTTRERMQFEAHCEAMPLEMMGMMVNIQRLRDARLADQALQAVNETGGPVVIITGNGHARSDWGAPAVLSVASDLTVFALGQSEDGTEPRGTFDLVLDSPGLERSDPCLAFR